VSFRHVVAARAVYGAISPRDQRDMHLRAGRALERAARQPAARLAYHFREAGEIGSWCRHAEAAVDLALDSGDEAAAVALLHDLLTNADLPAGTVARLVRKLPLTSMGGEARLRDLVAALRSVLTTGPLTKAGKAEIRSVLGRLLLVLEDYDEGRAELERAAPYLAPGSVEAVAAMALLGGSLGVDQPVSTHLRWLRRADEAASVAAMTPAQRLGWVVARASALLSSGEEAGWVEAARLPDTADTYDELRRIAHGHLNVGDQAMRWGRHAEASWRLALALRLSEQHEYARVTGLVRITLAHLDWFTSAWGGLAERAAALAEDEDLPPVSRSEAVLVLGLLHAPSVRTTRPGASSTTCSPRSGGTVIPLLHRTGRGARCAGAGRWSGRGGVGGHRGVGRHHRRQGDLAVGHRRGSGARGRSDRRGANRRGRGHGGRVRPWAGSSGRPGAAGGPAVLPSPGGGGQR
jgi:hypothetical protein